MRLSLKSASRMRRLKLSQKLFCIRIPLFTGCRQTLSGEGRDEMEMPDELVVLRPDEKGVRGELGSVVRDDHAGLAAAFDPHRQFTRRASAGNRGDGARGQAFTRHEERPIAASLRQNYLRENRSG